ncbi:MAG: ATP-binding cassette domain-containing protein, partial [Planctomycetota bacterium]
MVGISLRSVTKSYGETVAVRDVSFEVKKGELFFLLGPSGGGKTTILRLVAGFLTQEAGTIFFDERPIDPVPPHRRNTGMVFQNYALWPHMTV